MPFVDDSEVKRSCHSLFYKAFQRELGGFFDSVESQVCLGERRNQKRISIRLRIVIGFVPHVASVVGNREAGMLFGQIAMVNYANSAIILT